MSLTPCCEPRCPTLTQGSYCDVHTRERRRAADARRPTAPERGYDAAWRRTRGRYLYAVPACERCGQIATVVHHVDGLGPTGPLGHDDANLEALCKACHDRHTAEHQPGGWAAR